MPYWFTNPLVWAAVFVMVAWSLQRIWLSEFDKYLGIDPKSPVHTWREASAVIALNLIAALIVVWGFVTVAGRPQEDLRFFTVLDAAVWAYIALRCVSAVVCIGRKRRASVALDSISAVCGLYATAIGLIVPLLPA